MTSGVSGSNQCPKFDSIIFGENGKYRATRKGDKVFIEGKDGSLRATDVETFMSVMVQSLPKIKSQSTKDTFAINNSSFKSQGTVSYVKDNPFVRQVVTTPSGREVYIPTTLGATTTVEPLSNGTYKLITKPTTFIPKPETTKIITEEELIEKYGKYKPRNTGFKDK